MATYRILYWQEIPSQLEVEDDEQELKVMLDPKFIQQIDALAAKRGLTDADSYLAQWQWSEFRNREGTAEEVAQAIQTELEAEAHW